MSSLKFLDIVRSSFIQDKLLAETELENLITDKTINPKDKLELIREVVTKYRNASLDFTYWESFIESNIIMPTTNKEVGDNNPKGNN